MQMIGWIKSLFAPGHCQCGTKCKSLWVAVIALIIALWSMGIMHGYLG